MAEAVSAGLQTFAFPSGPNLVLIIFIGQSNNCVFGANKALAHGKVGDFRVTTMLEQSLEGRMEDFQIIKSG